MNRYIEYIPALYHVVIEEKDGNGNGGIGNITIYFDEDGDHSYNNDLNKFCKVITAIPALKGENRVIGYTRKGGIIELGITHPQKPRTPEYFLRTLIKHLFEKLNNFPLKNGTPTTHEGDEYHKDFLYIEEIKKYLLSYLLKLAVDEQILYPNKMFNEKHIDQLYKINSDDFESLLNGTHNIREADDIFLKNIYPEKYKQNQEDIKEQRRNDNEREQREAERQRKAIESKQRNENLFWK